MARRIALAALLAANIVVAILAFRDNQGYQFLLILYGAETLAIAALNLPKMLIVAATRPRPQLGREEGALRVVGALIGIVNFAAALAFGDRGGHVVHGAAVCRQDRRRLRRA